MKRQLHRARVETRVGVEDEHTAARDHARRFDAQPDAARRLEIEVEVGEGEASARLRKVHEGRETDAVDQGTYRPDRGRQASRDFGCDAALRCSQTNVQA